MHYYNEWDTHAAQWLQNLCDAGLLPSGRIDTRDIRTIEPSTLDGVMHAHFFSGIGGWPYALILAGWPPTRPLWTASCPCQPFSSAGKGGGVTDDRHLWPAFFRLVQECHPDTIVGEQVASAIGYGWLDGIRRDLEAEGYAVGSVVLGAHSVGAPHIRQRLYWVADAGYHESPRRAGTTHTDNRIVEGRALTGSVAASCGGDERVEFPESPGTGNDQRRLRDRVAETSTDDTGLGDTERDGCDALKESSGATKEGRLYESEGSGGGMGNHECPRLERGTGAVLQTGPTRSPWTSWDDYTLIPFRDGRLRRLEPGLEPLVDGLPFRLADGRTREGVSRHAVLRGIGNAIVPQVAAAFLQAFLATETVPQ